MFFEKWLKCVRAKTIAFDLLFVVKLIITYSLDFIIRCANYTVTIGFLRLCGHILPIVCVNGRNCFSDYMCTYASLQDYY